MNYKPKMLLMALVLYAGSISVNGAQFDPHTSVCSTEKYAAGGAYGLYVSNVVGDVMRETPNVQVRDSYKDIQVGPPERSAFAHGNCDDDTAHDECYECLREAWRNMGVDCGNSVGATVKQWRCYLRYESYRFDY